MGLVLLSASLRHPEPQNTSHRGLRPQPLLSLAVTPWYWRFQNAGMSTGLTLSNGTNCLVASIWGLSPCLMMPSLSLSPWSSQSWSFPETEASPGLFLCPASTVLHDPPCPRNQYHLEGTDTAEVGCRPETQLWLALDNSSVHYLRKLIPEDFCCYFLSHS